MSAEPLLVVRDLRTWFYAEAGLARAVDGVDLELAAGETLALVGESGSGKTVTALSLAQLVAPPGRIVSGSVRLGGRELVGLSERELAGIRGRRIAYVFQEARAALNPVLTIGEQVGEGLRRHERLRGAALRTRVSELLVEVGLADPDRVAGLYPHQMSGGMCQRAMIASAIACDPEVLVADEPTTALDAPLRARVLALLAELSARRGLAVLLVSHDLELVARTADRVAVLYAGRVVEEGPSGEVLTGPRHPYTRLLLGSSLRRAAPGEPVPTMPGRPAAPTEWPPGCRFAPRCPWVRAACTRDEPVLGGERHRVACPFADELEEGV